MSGIAGIIRFDGAPVDPALIKKMTHAMSYRGPDGINHWIKGSVALGQCMLCTTPESLEEHQPLTNEDESLVLVMDGRVDNWQELRKDLLSRGVRLRNRSDAELVLRSYEQWGEDCLAHIDGDFALVIWDTRKQKAFCARDRMGNKPFNYHWDGKALTFASELHAILLLPWMVRNFNEGVLAEYLAEEWYSRDETFWHGILRLIAAHQMQIDSKGPRINQYWTPDLHKRLVYKTDVDYVNHYHNLFCNTVKRLSRSHKPLAIEVSGGLDSSAIFALADKLLKTKQLLAPKINGYVLDFHDDPDANELEYSRAVGKKLGHQISEIQPSMKPLSWYRERAKRYSDFPQFPNGTMHLGIMNRALTDDCKVLLNGTGGDEWLGGSRIYYAEEITTGSWKQLLASLKLDMENAGTLKSLWWLCRFGFAPFLPEPIIDILRHANKLLFDKFNTREWLTPNLQRALSEQREKNDFSNNIRIRPIVQRFQINHLYNAYSILAHEAQERLHAHHGLEPRRPYWNTAMVQFSIMQPKRLHFHGGINKYLHRRALHELLPGLVLNRQTKAEFSVTYHHHLTTMEKILTQDIPARRYNWILENYPRLLYSNTNPNSKYAGWRESMLWILFGCDALAPES